MGVTITGNFAVIGSHALRINCPDFSRISTHPDLDLICSYADFERNVSKFKFWSTISSNKVLAYIEDQKLEILIDDNHPLLSRKEFKKTYFLQNIEFERLLVPSLNDLFSLKKSHVHYQIHWLKTIFDYHFLKQRCVDWQTDIDAVALHDYEKQKVESRATVAFKNKTAKEFFDQKPVERLFDHDFLHDQVKKTAVPMYKKILKQGQEVECDKSLFDNLSSAEKLFCVIEEAEVLALERCLIPWMKAGVISQIEDPTQKAYTWAIMRICTDITSGWFRDFCVDNYFQVCLCKTDLYSISETLLNKEKV